MERPIYANTLNVTSDGQNEVVLTFAQKYPAYDPLTTEIEMKEDVISAIVIPKSLADQLPDIINSMLKNGEQ